MKKILLFCMFIFGFQCMHVYSMVILKNGHKIESNKLKTIVKTLENINGEFALVRFWMIENAGGKGKSWLQLQGHEIKLLKKKGLDIEDKDVIAVIKLAVKRRSASYLLLKKIEDICLIY